MKKASVLIGVFWLGLGAGASAQTLSVGVASGIFLPEHQTYQDVYGNSLPLDFEVRLGLFQNLGVAAGVTYIGDSGNAVNVNQGQDGYPVKFRRFSFPLSAYFLYPVREFSFFGGAGVTFHSYEEEWQNVSLSHSGNKTKPLFYGGAEYRIGPRLAVRVTARYESITAEKNPFVADEINLGGLTLLAGVSLRIFR